MVNLQSFGHASLQEKSEHGLGPASSGEVLDDEHRSVFGGNTCPPSPEQKFLALFWDIAQDPVILLLIATTLVSTALVWGATLDEHLKESTPTDGVATWAAAAVVIVASAWWIRGVEYQSKHATTGRDSYSCAGSCCGVGPRAGNDSSSCSEAGRKGTCASSQKAGSPCCCQTLEQMPAAGGKQAMFRGGRRKMRKKALWLCAVVRCGLLCLPPVQAQPPTGPAAPAADEPPPASDTLEAFEILIEILQKVLELLKLCLELWAIRAALAPRPAGNVPQAGAGGANGVAVTGKLISNMFRPHAAYKASCT